MGYHFWLGYNRLSLLPTLTLLSIFQYHPPASRSSYCSILMEEAATLGAPHGDTHRKKLRPSVLQPVRNWGMPAATQLSRKQMDPPPAEPAGETAAPSHTWHPAQPRILTRGAWEMTHALLSHSVWVMCFTTENEYIPGNQIFEGPSQTNSWTSFHTNNWIIRRGTFE